MHRSGGHRRTYVGHYLVAEFFWRSGNWRRSLDLFHASAGSTAAVGIVSNLWDEVDTNFKAHGEKGRRK
jgi:hypothetical protein